VRVDSPNWSGEGHLTQLLIERLSGIEAIEFLRVEDAPATRSEADYQFISNEMFVGFRTVERREPFRLFGLLPAARRVTQRLMTMTVLEETLTAMADVGPPDYSDPAMLQYLRTERVVPPYQTRGYKLVELVRIYEAGAASRS